MLTDFAREDARFRGVLTRDGDDVSAEEQSLSIDSGSGYPRGMIFDRGTHSIIYSAWPEQVLNKFGH